MREERSLLLSILSDSQPKFPGTIYSERSDRNKDGSCLNLITVVMSLDWPTEKGRPLPSRTTLKNVRMASIAGAIYRLQDFLERQLMSEISLLDVKPGCITVRFDLGENIQIQGVASALSHLDKVRLGFDVISIAGHVQGRAVKF